MLPAQTTHLFVYQRYSRHNPILRKDFTTTGQWTLIVNQSTANDDHSIDEYPRVHLAPSGQSFSRHSPRTKSGFMTRLAAHTRPMMSSQVIRVLSGSELRRPLPILPNDPNHVWVLHAARTPRKFQYSFDGYAEWLDTGDRQPIDGERPVRRHACSVLLPTGRFFSRAASARATLHLAFWCLNYTPSKLGGRSLHAGRNGNVAKPDQRTATRFSVTTAPRSCVRMVAYGRQGRPKAATNSVSRSTNLTILPCKIVRLSVPMCR